MTPATYARLTFGAPAASFARADGDDWALLTDAPWLGGAETGTRVRRDEATLVAPVTPSKIICVGRNYRDHAKELGNEVPAEPLLFFKPPSALVGPGHDIALPAVSSRVDHEAELGVVIGTQCRSVRADHAHGVIFGYTAVNDVTARDLQKKDGQWARAKGFDSFCPVGPFVVTGLDASAIAVKARVNGQERQHGNTRDLIFSVADLIAYISAVMTLERGDLIATGTPAGVGPLAPGDLVEVEVEGVGVLHNRVRGGGERDR